EFYCPEGEILSPLCAVAFEDGKWFRFSRGEFPATPPFCTSPDSVLVCFEASSELSFYEVLGWDFPPKVIDLHAEYLNYTNFLERDGKPEHGLLHALTHFRIPHISSFEKDRLRKIAIDGGPRTPEEAQSLLRYCESDVLPLVELYKRLISPKN